ncbi:MAG: ECF-type sigma factor, partial [Rhodospirillales bacterium]|nr:ECF-type sigma factor [Rhodospirillales bacterium]
MSEPSATQPQDELVSAARAGDRLAIERLFLMLHPRLRNRIARKIPNELSATLGPDDVLQETFAKAIRSIKTLEPCNVEQFYRWLATVAEHRLLDMIRERRALKRGGGRVQVTGGDEEPGNDLLEIAMQ